MFINKYADFVLNQSINAGFKMFRSGFELIANHLYVIQQLLPVELALLVYGRDVRFISKLCFNFYINFIFIEI